MRKNLSKVLLSSAVLATVAITPISSLTPVLAQGYNVRNDNVQDISYTAFYNDENVEQLNLTSQGYADIYAYNQDALVVQNSDGYIYEAKSKYNTNYKMDNGESKYFLQKIYGLDDGVIAAIEGLVRYQGTKYFDIKKQAEIGIDFKYTDEILEADDYDHQWALYSGKLQTFIVPCQVNGSIKYCLFDKDGNYIETTASYYSAGNNFSFYEQGEKEQFLGFDNEGNYYIYDNNGERKLDVNSNLYNHSWNAIYNGKVKIGKQMGSSYNSDKEYYILDVNTGEISFITKIEKKPTSSSWIVGDNGGASTSYEAQLIGDSLIIKKVIYNANGESYDISDVQGSIEETGEVKKYYLVSNGDTSMYIDAQGNKYGEEYKKVGKFINGRAIVLDNDNNAYLIDENFNRVSSIISSVEDIATLSDGYYKVKIGDLYYGASFEQEAIDVPDGLNEVDGVWGYYKNGYIDKKFNGLVENEAGWWKVTNGYIDFDYDGLAENEYGWWKITNGTVDFEYNGMAENEYGWWKVTNGAVDLSFNGLADNEYGWWKITNGTVDFFANGLQFDEGTNTWWYFNDGAIDRNYTGLAENEYGWWKITDGTVDFNYNGMAENEYGWWKVANGTVDFNFNGMAENEYGWWYLTNGTVDFNYNGVAENQYGWWKITNGAVDFTANGLIFDTEKNTWFYFNNGAIDFNYTGLAENENGWWKIANGTVDFGYNGQADNQYGTWNVVNGHVEV